MGARRAEAPRLYAGGRATLYASGALYECPNCSKLQAICCPLPVPGDTRGLVAWSSGKSMRCQNCSAENLQGAKFCIECATPFQHRCQKCGFENPSEARFCAQCAAPLDAAAPIRPVTEPHHPLTGERRHLTVLFCDLVNSTTIAAQLDPEEWREIVAGYHHAAAQAIERFGGHVAQYLGDGVMAFFGYPEAHDSGACRPRRLGDARRHIQAQRAPHASKALRQDRHRFRRGGGGRRRRRAADVFGDTPNIPRAGADGGSSGHGTDNRRYASAGLRAVRG
jgi:Double zinc ribbon/Adenylate and Guanylate cyclase catalytic domain